MSSKNRERIGHLYVYKVAKSRKDYKDNTTGETIPAGSEYYWWKWRCSEKKRSIVKPTNLDMYGDTVESVFSSLIDRMQEAVDNEEFDSDLLQEAQDFLEERETALSNIEEYFPESPVGERLTEMIDELNEYITSLENLE